MNYGKIIKEYREKNLLSQQEFADFLRHHQQVWVDINQIV